MRNAIVASLVLLSCQHAQFAERSRIPEAVQEVGSRELVSVESKLLAEQGLVVLSGDEVTSFHMGYSALFKAHQPVYITADSLLYAWHTSYDSLLIELEHEALIPALTTLLAELREGLARRSASEARADLDLYLAIAQSLLTGSPPEPVGGADPAAIAQVVAWGVATEGPAPLVLFGRAAEFDFSMLKPRGHYTQSAELQRYFRAMSFLGRVELRLARKDGNKPWVADRRAVRAAVLLDSLCAAPIRARWQAIDTTLASLVGPPDSMSLPGLNQGLAAVKSVDTATDAAIAQAFEGVAQQRIRTQLVHEGEKSIAFVLLGQRFVFDSRTFSQLTYGSLETDPLRMMPSPLDVAHSVFHHPLARELLEPELKRYGAPFAAALDAEWKATDAEDPALWTGSVYHGWLKALRELSPDPRRDQALPAPLNSKAWGRRMLNGQLASWAELRHDNLLYAKQSTTMMALCEFPFGYVDPYPGFYEAMAQLAARTSAAYEALPFKTPRMAAVLSWLARMQVTMNRLRDIAARERANQPLLASDREFFNGMVALGSRSAGCTSVTEAEGWYGELFYDRSKALWHEALIADVHTQPTDEAGNLVGFVLHVGTANPRMMVVTIQHDGGAHAQTYRGFVSTYAEKQAANFQRLTDEEWRAMLRDAPPETPGWMAPIVAPRCRRACR